MTIEISNKGNLESSQTWKLYNQWVKEEITREIRKYLVTNENKYTIHQNVRIAAKAVLRGKHGSKCLTLKKEEKSQIKTVFSTLGY